MSPKVSAVWTLVFPVGGAVWGSGTFRRWRKYVTVGEVGALRVYSLAPLPACLCFLHVVEM